MTEDGKTSPPCDLCGLDVETDAFTIRTQDGVLKFCCDGCEGIYRMLNDVTEIKADDERAAE